MLTLCAALLAFTLGVVGQSGRRRAKEAVCQANLRQWCGIFQGYVKENAGQFVEGETPMGWYWIKSLKDQDRNWRRMRIWFCPEAEVPAVDERGRPASRPSVFAAWGIFAGNELPGMAGSYGLNGYVIPIPEQARYENDVRASYGWRNLREVPNASRVPMFVDALRFDLWPLETNRPAPSEWADWSNNYMARCCINRHSGTVNCLFVDGSVRKVGLKELWTLKWHKSFNTAGPWTKAGGVQLEDWPEWIRPFKDY